MRNSSSLDWLRFMHTPNDYRVSPNPAENLFIYLIYDYISSNNNVFLTNRIVKGLIEKKIIF